MSENKVLPAGCLDGDLMFWIEPKVGKLMRCDICKQVIGEYLVAKDGSTHAVCRSCGDMHQDIYGGYQEFVLAYQWVMASVYHADVHRWVQTAMHAHTAYVQHNLITETDEMRVLDMAEHAAGMDY